MVLIITLQDDPPSRRRFHGSPLGTSAPSLDLVKTTEGRWE